VFDSYRGTFNCLEQFWLGHHIVLFTEQEVLCKYGVGVQALVSRVPNQPLRLLIELHLLKLLVHQLQLPLILCIGHLRFALCRDHSEVQTRHRQPRWRIRRLSGISLLLLPQPALPLFAEPFINLLHIFLELLIKRFLDDVNMLVSKPNLLSGVLLLLVRGFSLLFIFFKDLLRLSEILLNLLKAVQ